MTIQHELMKIAAAAGSHPLASELVYPRAGRMLIAADGTVDWVSIRHGVKRTRRRISQPADVRLMAEALLVAQHQVDREAPGGIDLPVDFRSRWYVASTYAPRRVTARDYDVRFGGAALRVEFDDDNVVFIGREPTMDEWVAIGANGDPFPASHGIVHLVLTCAEIQALAARAGVELRATAPMLAAACRLPENTAYERVSAKLGGVYAVADGMHRRADIWGAALPRIAKSDVASRPVAADVMQSLAEPLEHDDRIATGRLAAFTFPPTRPGIGELCLWRQGRGVFVHPYFDVDVVRACLFGAAGAIDTLATTSVAAVEIVADAMVEIATAPDDDPVRALRAAIEKLSAARDDNGCRSAAEALQSAAEQIA